MTPKSWFSCLLDRGYIFSSGLHLASLTFQKFVWISDLVAYFKILANTIWIWPKLPQAKQKSYRKVEVLINSRLESSNPCKSGRRPTISYSSDLKSSFHLTIQMGKGDFLNSSRSILFNLLSCWDVLSSYHTITGNRCWNQFMRP